MGQESFHLVSVPGVTTEWRAENKVWRIKPYDPVVIPAKAGIQKFLIFLASGSLVRIIRAQSETSNTVSSRGKLGRGKALGRTAAMPCWALASTFVFLKAFTDQVRPASRCQPQACCLRSGELAPRAIMVNNPG
jgi:hypothetical protein